MLFNLNLFKTLTWLDESRSDIKTLDEPQLHRSIYLFIYLFFKYVDPYGIHVFTWAKL